MIGAWVMLALVLAAVIADLKLEAVGWSARRADAWTWASRGRTYLSVSCWHQGVIVSWRSAR